MDSYVGSLSVSVTNMMEYQFLKKSLSKNYKEAFFKSKGKENLPSEVSTQSLLLHGHVK